MLPYASAKATTDESARAEHLHGELATWQGEHTLQVESKPDHAAGTPFRITVHEHHMVAPGTYNNYAPRCDSSL